MKEEKKQPVELPENAFRELKEGEEYQPIMSPDKVYPEVNAWSVSWGIVMAVIFSAAAAYLGLKVGQVFEAAIPIAIIAVSLSGAFKRKNALGETVDRCLLGCDCGRCYLYLACTLYLAREVSRYYGKLYGGIPQFVVGWYIGYIVPHTFP